mgnify:CR=1 FL=1
MLSKHSTVLSMASSRWMLNAGEMLFRGACLLSRPAHQLSSSAVTLPDRCPVNTVAQGVCAAYPWAGGGGGTPAQ